MSTPTAHDQAATYAARRESQLSRIGHGCAHEVRQAFIAGHEAAKADPSLTAPLVAAARSRERERVAGIFRLPECEGRTAMAEHVAFTSDLTVEQARTLLASAPVERTRLLAPEQDALFKGALRGAGLADQSPLSYAMRAEGGARVPSQPSRDPAVATVASLDHARIFAARKAQSHGPSSSPSPAAA